MTIHMVEQGTEAWHALRCGRVTASRIKDVCAKTQKGWGAGRANYKAELILERLTGRPFESYVSQDMLVGTQREPDARAEYELRMRCEVQQIGFVEHPTLSMAGASADGFIGDDGLLEIKCPKAATHLDYLRAGAVPADYIPQIMWNFACNPGRTYCDFVSYHPDFPEPMVLFVKRIERDDKKIAELEAIVSAFLDEIEQDVAELRAKYLERRNVLHEKLQASVAMLEAS